MCNHCRSIMIIEHQKQTLLLASVLSLPATATLWRHCSAAPERLFFYRYRYIFPVARNASHSSPISHGVVCVLSFLHSSNSIINRIETLASVRSVRIDLYKFTRLKNSSASSTTTENGFSMFSFPFSSCTTHSQNRLEGEEEKIRGKTVETHRYIRPTFRW